MRNSKISKEEFQELMSTQVEYVKQLFEEREVKLNELHNLMREVRPFCYVGGFEDALELAHKRLYDLCVARTYARYTGQWAIADEIRQKVWDESIVFEDAKDYTYWRVYPFDLYGTK